MIKKISNHRQVAFHDDNYDFNNDIVDTNLMSTDLVIGYYDRNEKIKDAILDLGMYVNEICVHCIGWPCMTKDEAIKRTQWLRKLGLRTTRVIIDTQLLVTDEDGTLRCHIIPSEWKYRNKSTYDIIS